MNLQPYSENILPRHEFLYSTQMLSFKVGGVTLDSSAFTAGEYVDAGTLVMVSDVNELAVPYDTDTLAGGRVYVIANDVKIPESGNAVVGAVEEGYLHAGKIKGTFVAETLETDSNFRFRVRSNV